MGLRIFFTFAWVKRVWQIKSIRTVRTDGIGCSQSVYDPKMRLRIYFTSYLCQGGLTDHVHPYGPYRWNRPFSIRIRSENCMSLMGLRIYFTSYLSPGVSRVVDPYGRTDGIGRFQSVHDWKIASINGTFNISPFLPEWMGCHGLSIRTVCTDGIGRFQSVHDRKIASINGTYNIFSYWRQGIVSARNGRIVFSQIPFNSVLEYL